MVMIESHDVNDADGYDASMIAASVTLDGRTDKHHFPPKDSHLRGSSIFGPTVYYIPLPFIKTVRFPL